MKSRPRRTPPPELGPSDAPTVPATAHAAARAALEALPADHDPVWRLARAERELARVQRAEHARWFARLALLRARCEPFGAAVEVVLGRPRAGWRGELTRHLADRGAETRPGAALLQGCLAAPLESWPASGEFLRCADRSLPRGLRLLATAITTLAEGRTQRARAAALALLQHGLHARRKLRAHLVLALACWIEGDAPGVGVHLAAVDGRLGAADRERLRDGLALGRRPEAAATARALDTALRGAARLQAQQAVLRRLARSAAGAGGRGS